MANYNDLPAYKASYDLVLEIFKQVKEFNKEYKYTIGENIKKESIKLLMLIYKANSTRDKGKIILRAREKLEVIRMLVRITKDLHQINTKKLVLLNKKIEKVSKQLTGWQKSLKNN